MATFLVTNSLYPANPKKFTVSIDKVIKPYGETGTKFSKKGSDDLFWELHIAVADAVDTEGNPVPSIWKDVVSNEETTVDALIVSAVNEIASRIDWSEGGTYEMMEDIYPPLVTSTVPASNEENVNIHQRIFVTIEDFLPAKGIDVDTIKLFVDGIEVVPTSIVGNPFRYEISYKVPYVLEQIEEE